MSADKMLHTGNLVHTHRLKTVRGNIASDEPILLGGCTEILQQWTNSNQ